MTMASPSPRIEAVVIGASAGGVEALGVLFAALPASFALPILAVLHIPADRPTLLPAIYSARTALAVREAMDKEPITPGAIYIAPPGCHLQIEPDRRCALSLDEPVNFSRPSIDVLFESAAYAYRERLLGIVLTGASADGAKGLAAIRSRGGLGWVQTPAEAMAPAMPAAALAEAGADAVLSLRQISLALAQLPQLSTETNMTIRKRHER